MNKYAVYSQIIIFNLTPLVGLFIWDWTVFDVIFIYWAENMIIGAFHAIHLGAIRLSYIPSAIFFAFHFGMFTLIHGGFVVSLFGRQFLPAEVLESPEILASFLINQHHFDLAIIPFILLHLSDKIRNIMQHGLTLKSLPGGSMGPYGRLIILHVTLIIGGFLMMALQAPTAGLVVLILLKVGYDLYNYRKQLKALESSIGE